MFLLMIKHRTNIVSAIPKNHVTPDLKNLDSLLICTLSDILEIIPSAVPTRTSGKSTDEIMFPINVIIKSRTGCTVDAVTKFPCCYH